MHPLGMLRLVLLMCACIPGVMMVVDRESDDDGTQVRSTSASGVQAQSPIAPDGGSREGAEPQLIPTVITITARIHSWLDRQYNEGVAEDGAL